MIHVFHHSEPGGHAENEDYLRVGSHPAEPECLLCVIADGQGGNFGGAAAARIACQTTLDASVAFSSTKLGLPTTWLEILGAADTAVADNSKAGFTALVAFAISSRWICGASTGDCAAVLFQVGKQSEILTARQRKNPAVGSRNAHFIPFAAELSHPWSVLAMTDGVWKYAGWDRLLQCSVTKSGEQVCNSLRHAAKLSRTGALQDDFTLVVLQDHGK